MFPKMNNPVTWVNSIDKPSHLLLFVTKDPIFILVSDILTKLLPYYKNIFF